MRPYTTPMIVVTIGADLTDCDVYLTLRQSNKMMNLSKFDSIDVADGKTTISVTLTQQQSAKFSSGAPIEVQANVIDTNGYRVASDIAKLSVSPQLMQKVLTKKET